MPKMSAKNENCNTWTWANWIIFRFCIFSANDCFDSRGCVMLSSFQHWTCFCEDHKRWYSQSQSLLNISFEASSCIYADTIELASHFWSQRRMNLIIIVSLLRGTKILLIFAPDKCSCKRCNWCRRLCLFFHFAVQIFGLWMLFLLELCKTHIEKVKVPIVPIVPFSLRVRGWNSKNVTLKTTRLKIYTVLTQIT